MPEMRIAGITHNFVADHAVARVSDRLHLVARERQPKTWPTGPGVILVLRTEQFCSAANASICSIVLVIDEFARKRVFRTLVLCHLVLLVGEPVPKVVALFADFVHMMLPMT